MDEVEEPRINMRISPEERAAISRVSGGLKPTTWAKGIIRRELRRIADGQAHEELTETERDALRALRFLAGQPDGAATALIGSIAGSMYSPAVRDRLVEFAAEASALLEGHAREAPDTLRAAEPPPPPYRPKKGKG